MCYTGTGWRPHVQLEKGKGLAAPPQVRQQQKYALKWKNTVRTHSPRKTITKREMSVPKTNMLYTLKALSENIAFENVKKKGINFKMLLCRGPWSLVVWSVVFGVPCGRGWAHRWVHLLCQSGIPLLGSSNMESRSGLPPGGAQEALMEAFRLPYNVPCSLPDGLPWSSASRLQGQWEGPVRRPSDGTWAAPPRRPGPRSEEAGAAPSPARRPGGCGCSLASWMYSSRRTLGSCLSTLSLDTPRLRNSP